MCESLIKLQALVADLETDAEFLTRLDAQDAAEKARLATEYRIEESSFDDEPSIDDWCDYAKVQEWYDAQDEQFGEWLDRENGNDERSTFYIS